MHGSPRVRSTSVFLKKSAWPPELHPSFSQAALFKGSGAPSGPVLVGELDVSSHIAICVLGREGHRCRGSRTGAPLSVDLTSYNKGRGYLD